MMAGGRTLSKVLELNFSLVTRLKNSFLGESNTLGFVVHLAMFQNILICNFRDFRFRQGQDDIMIMEELKLKETGAGISPRIVNGSSITNSFCVVESVLVFLHARVLG